MHSMMKLTGIAVAALTVLFSAASQAEIADLAGTYRATRGICKRTDGYRGGQHDLKITVTQNAVMLEFDYHEGMSSIDSYYAGYTGDFQGGGRQMHFISIPAPESVRLVKSDTDYRGKIITQRDTLIRRNGNALHLKLKERGDIVLPMDCEYQRL